MQSWLFAHSNARTATFVIVSTRERESSPQRAPLAVAIIVVMIATTCSHEHGIIAVIVIEHEPGRFHAPVLVEECLVSQS